MRSITFCTLVCALLLGLPLAAIGQPNVDLSVTSLNYDEVSPGMISFQAQIQLASFGDGDAFVTEVRFLLDGVPVTSVPLAVGDRTAGSCSTNVPPDCDGSCPTIMIDGSSVDGVCVDYQDECVCLYLQTVNSPEVPFSDGDQLTAVVDPDNLVEETDEDNNSFDGPVDSGLASWGTMKALYR